MVCAFLPALEQIHNNDDGLVGVDLFFVQQHIRTTGQESGKGCLCGCAVCWCRQVRELVGVRLFIYVVCL
jgi:hypothetical protein